MKNYDNPQQLKWLSRPHTLLTPTMQAPSGKHWRKHHFQSHWPDGTTTCCSHPPYSFHSPYSILCNRNPK